MLDFLKKDNKINVPQIADEIENAVYAHLKSYAFKKHGRTLHRFVSGDISQVIHFQSGLQGLQGLLCVNVGIRIPECSEKVFFPQSEMKKYYHEYECTIRSRLGTVSGKPDATWYDLSKRTDKIINGIIKEIDEVVLPAFEILNSREAILAHRADFPYFDSLCKNPLLDESMIYGHLGDTEKAKALFELYYRTVVDEYEDKCKNGRKQYLKKGQRIVSMGQDITAEKDGYVTLYGASHSHIDYLDDLAIKLRLR